MKFLLSLFIFMTFNFAFGHGPVSSTSSLDFKQTLEKITDEINSRGLNIFAKIDHKAGAEGVGLELRPTTVVIFGNPNAGTRLMQENQKVGLDLPLKILITKNKSGVVMLTYEPPHVLKEKYGLKNNDIIIGRITNLFNALTQSVK